ncbi:MAG: glycosyltransferase family A protein [Candidatus Obscuribacterales bacterium]|nr:glycosyltransferase family A protein [Candidatus Obscuribacterales bacterium]
MSQVDISIIVTTHSEGRLAHPTLKSVTAAIAECKKVGITTEWLIVVDRPTPDLLNYLEAFPPACNRIETTDFGDPGLARNHAIKLIKGKYVTVLDGDDLWSANWLTAAYAFCENFPKPCVAHCETKIMFERKEFIAHNIDQESPDFHPEGLLEKNYWNPSCFARRETFLEHPYAASDLPNGIGYEDWYWNLEIMKGGKLHKVVPQTMHAIRFKSWKTSQLATSAANECVMMASNFFNLPFQEGRGKQ